MIENYITKVVSYLPFKDRKDVSEELETLIMDMCQDDMSDENILNVLKDLGHPRELALDYGEKKGLIGPEYFGRYKELLVLVLKVALPIIFILSFISNAYNTQLITIENQKMARLIANLVYIIIFSLGAVLSAAFSIFAIVTFIFAILERRQETFEIFEYDFKSKTENTKQRSEKSYLLEGIITIIGTIFFLFVIYNPEFPLIGSVENGVFQMNQGIFVAESFASLTPYVLLVVATALIVTAIKIYTRKNSKLLITAEILHSLSSLALLIFALLTPNLINPYIINILNHASVANIAQVIPFALLTIPILNIFQQLYYLYKLDK